jgi:hypothetical protein
MKIFIMADRKIVDDTHHITQKRGNGQLRHEIRVDAQGQVTRYNLAYINHALHGGDNGRVVGYDNQHGFTIGTISVLSPPLNSRVLTTSKISSKPIGLHSGAPHEKCHP